MCLITTSTIWLHVESLPRSVISINNLLELGFRKDGKYDMKIMCVLDVGFNVNFIEYYEVYYEKN